MSEKALVEKTTKFDPTKNYAWEKDTLFTLSGTEFALIFNHLNQFMKAPITIESSFKLLDISMILQQKLSQAVESGEAKEAIPDHNGPNKN